MEDLEAPPGRKYRENGGCPISQARESGDRNLSSLRTARVSPVRRLLSPHHASNRKRRIVPPQRKRPPNSSAVLDSRVLGLHQGH